MSDGTKHPILGRLLRSYSTGAMDRREFLRGATALGVTATAAYSLINAVDPTQAMAQSGSGPAKGGTIRVQNRLDRLVHLHAINNLWLSIVARAYVERLAETGPDNITRPHLLEKWEPSDDLKTWTLHIRRGVTWRKGGELNADQVIWNFKSVLDPAVGSSTLGLMKSYMLADNGKDFWDPNAIEKVDDHTVRLNIKTPQLYLPEHLAHYAFPIIDPAENGKADPGANGTGAFELVEYAPRQRGVFKARSDYWGDGPYVDKFEFVDLGEDSSTHVAALASKQVDGLLEAQISAYQALKSMPHLQEYTVDTATTFVVRGKLSKKPFDDVRVRQAMRLATDTKLTTLACRGELGTPAEHHHVAPSQPDYSQLPSLPRDVEKAKALLAEAGYPDGLDIAEPLVYPTDIAWFAPAAQALAEQWAEAGIRVTLNPMSAAQYWEVWNKVPFSITRWNHRPHGVMTLALCYKTGVPWNESEYSNPKFDEILNKVESTLDLEERKVLVKQLEEIMQSDGPIVQTTWARISTFYNKKVKGFDLHPSLYLSPNKLSIES